MIKIAKKNSWKCYGYLFSFDFAIEKSVKCLILLPWNDWISKWDYWFWTTVIAFIAINNSLSSSLNFNPKIFNPVEIRVLSCAFKKHLNPSMKLELLVSCSWNRESLNLLKSLFWMSNIFFWITLSKVKAESLIFYSLPENSHKR